MSRVKSRRLGLFPSSYRDRWGVGCGIGGVLDADVAMGVLVPLRVVLSPFRGCLWSCPSFSGWESIPFDV